MPEGADADANPATGWSGGFSCVIGNPPWERVKLQEQEFFAAHDEGIANAKKAAACKIICHPSYHLAESLEPGDITEGSSHPFGVLVRQHSMREARRSPR